MPTSSFEKRPNKVIYDTLNSHRPFNMYKMVINCGYMVGYHVLDMFLIFRDKIMINLFQTCDVLIFL